MNSGDDVPSDQMQHHKKDVAMATAAWRTSRSRYRKCRFPNCNDTVVIDSHSLTQHHCLKAIEVDGWVYQPLFRDSGKILRRAYSHDRIYPSVDRIETSRASVFNWYCAVHDNELFKHIDVAELEYNNQMQARELYLRAMSRNIANHEDGAFCVTEFDKLRANRGIINEEYLSASVLAYESDMEHLWIPYWNTDIADTVKYYWRVIPGNLGVAVSAMYPMAGEANASQWYFSCGARPMVSLSVIPQSNDLTHVVFAWWYEWDEIMREFVSRLEDYSNEQFLYVVNQIVVKEIDGYCISPKVWERLANKERQALEYFQQSDMCHDPTLRTPPLISSRNAEFMKGM